MLDILEGFDEEGDPEEEEGQHEDAGDQDDQEGDLGKKGTGESEIWVIRAKKWSKLRKYSEWNDMIKEKNGNFTQVKRPDTNLSSVCPCCWKIGKMLWSNLINSSNFLTLHRGQSISWGRSLNSLLASTSSEGLEGMGQSWLGKAIKWLINDQIIREAGRPVQCHRHRVDRSRGRGRGQGHRLGHGHRHSLVSERTRGIRTPSYAQWMAPLWTQTPKIGQSLQLIPNYGFLSFFPRLWAYLEGFRRAKVQTTFTAGQWQRKRRIGSIDTVPPSPRPLHPPPPSASVVCLSFLSIPPSAFPFHCALVETKPIRNLGVWVEW